MYIERKAAFAKIKSLKGPTRSPAQNQLIQRAMIDIAGIPAADVEPVKRGEWVLRHEGHGHYWECSACHKNPCIYVTKDTNYCPNCGAKMKG